VKFGGKKNEKRVTTPEETTFHLLHLSLLREYLDLEFTPLKSLLPFPYDLERIIDDWVRFIHYFIGHCLIFSFSRF
jgi:5'-3' exoribonuclease 1